MREPYVWLCLRTSVETPVPIAGFSPAVAIAIDVLRHVGCENYAPGPDMGDYSGQW